MVDRRGRAASEQRTPTSATTCSTASTATCSSAGIIDPVKVTRSALENAASIAGMILTTEALDHRHAREEAGAAGGMPGGMGGMGGMDY